MNDPMTVAKKALNAYADSDRSALEAVIAEDFHFTSPIDNRQSARSQDLLRAMLAE